VTLRLSVRPAVNATGGRNTARGRGAGCDCGRGAYLGDGTVCVARLVRGGRATTANVEPGRNWLG